MPMPWRSRRDSYVTPRIRRRRRWRRGMVLFGAILALSALLDHSGLLRYKGNDWRMYDQKDCAVVNVSDGDTLTVRPIDGTPETKVRLLGIDAPETHTVSGGPAFWAKQATDYLDGRTRDRIITLRLEPTQTRDKYRRLLAYLYVSESEILNMNIVRDGQAYADRRFPHTFRPQIEQAESEARQKKRGLWKEVREEEMPEWRRKWLEDKRKEKEGN